MATAGFPGAFQAGTTTGFLSIGAVQTLVVSAGFPGAFQAGTTTGYLNIGAVQKAVAAVVAAVVAVSTKKPQRMMMGVGL